MGRLLLVERVGACDGDEEGRKSLIVGKRVGLLVGCFVGFRVFVRINDGTIEGMCEGALVGRMVDGLKDLAVEGRPVLTGRVVSFCTRGKNVMLGNDMG